MAVARWMKPEFDFRGVLLKARSMRHAGRDVIPVAGAVAMLLAMKRQDELALRDHADVLRLVIVRLNRSSGRVRCEEDIAIVRLQLECVEGPGKARQATNQRREMAHSVSMGERAVMRHDSRSAIVRITRHGLPAANTSGGMSFTTMLSPPTAKT